MYVRATFFELSHSYVIILCRNATGHVHLQICVSLEENSPWKRQRAGNIPVDFSH